MESTFEASLDQLGLQQFIIVLLDCTKTEGNSLAVVVSIFFGQKGYIERDKE